MSDTTVTETSAVHADQTLSAKDTKKVLAAFDVALYRARLGNTQQSDADLFEHFLNEGWKIDLDPSDSFSTRAYLDCYPDVAKQGINPLVHYVLEGRDAGYRAYSPAVARDITPAALDYTRPFFDPDFYERASGQNTDFDTLLRHFLAYGWRDGLNPSAYFDVAFYLAANEDIRSAEMNPLLHFAMSGQSENRAPAEDASAGRVTDAEYESVKPLFDADVYRAQSPDFADFDDDTALRHFMNTGWRLGFDAAKDFSAAFYLDRYTDVADAGLNPLLHYAVTGQAEHRAVRAEDLVGEFTRREVELAAAHFDADFYRSANTELRGASGQDALLHYLTLGWRDGADPSARFSTRYYLDTNPDIADGHMCPLLHYAAAGEAEGRAALPPHLAIEIPADDLTATAPLFDAEFYQSTYVDVTGSDTELHRHYMAIGWTEGRDPSPHFSTEFYLSQYPDIADGDMNPLLHYALAGQAEGRAAQRSELVDGLSPGELKGVAPFFDADFYRRTYPGVKGDDHALLVHYMETGWREGKDPSAEFSTQFYLDTYADIAAGGINPLTHYATAGQNEGRAATARALHAGEISEEDLVTVAPHFDAEYYRGAYADVSGTDAELLEHFMTLGWREGKDPSLNFSVAYYLDTYSDIREGGINPLLHYTVSGRAEGRRALARGPSRLRRDPNADMIPEHLSSVMPLAPAEDWAVLPKTHKANPAALDIHWIVPDFQRGGGGHMTIFRMVSHLENFGHRCKIWIEAPTVHDTADEAYQDIIKYFQCVQADVAFVRDGFVEATGDAVIATGWSTAFLAEQSRGFAAKYYFVQDHEVEFYPTGTEALLARQTYDFDLAAICASPWLDKIMTEKYGRWARHFYLAYDKEQYNIQDMDAYLERFAEDRTGPVKIAVYARGHTARRCIDLSLIALDALVDRGLDFEVHFFGQERLPFSSARFPALNHSVLDSDELCALYADCDLGICFSATNYSLVPQEMMACGLPLVELDNGSTREIFPKGVVTLAGPDPLDIADKLDALIRDPQARKTQAAKGLEWVEGFSWRSSARDVEAAIIEYLETQTKHAAPAVKPSRDVLMDVIIPTYNGLGELEPVIEALRTQDAYDRIQIYCVDSSSPDGTADWLKKQPDISTTVIDQKDFQHGRTRNDAIALGSSPFIGVLTQDAMPAHKYWAGDILKMMHHYPQAAGLFGRHLPYPDHPLFVREEITNHFANMLKRPLAVSKFTDPEAWEKPERSWHQFLHFYSDNNSAMRRAVWNDIPYPEVDYGEDQVWAYDIIKAGHTKLYAPTAAVFHSHDYNPEETYKRSRTEGAFFHRYFGYELGKGTKKQLARRIAREQAEVQRWGKRNGRPDSEIEMRQANIAEKYRGWRDGVAQSQVETEAAASA